MKRLILKFEILEKIPNRKIQLRFGNPMKFQFEANLKILSLDSIVHI